MNAVSSLLQSSNLFKTRAEAVSAQVQRVATKELAMELIVRLLHQEGVDRQAALARRMGCVSDDRRRGETAIWKARFRA